MTSVFRELPLSYARLSAGRRCGSAAAVHKPSPAGPPLSRPSIARAEPSAGAPPPRRSRQSSTSRVRLLARKKRFKTVALLVAERNWQPPRPRFVHDQIVGLRVALATWQSATG